LSINGTSQDKQNWELWISDFTVYAIQRLSSDCPLGLDSVFC